LIPIKAIVGATLLASAVTPAAYASEGPQDTAYVKQASEGEVTLELSPRWQDSVLVVEIRANTHSVDLSSVDLGEQTRLIVDGTEVNPVEAGSLSGHHAQATVVFRLEKRPSSFTIEVRDIPDVPLRVLTWPAGETTP
jgi:hypothetical protein